MNGPDRALLDRLAQIAQEAGREIMAVHATAFESTAKPDGSPVTEADLRADRVIRAALARDFPGIAVVSEEAAPDIASAPQRFFLVDPLDGTKEFIARNGEFTVNIALVDGERAVAGVVLAPALGECFVGAAGLGACKRSAHTEHAIRTSPVAAGATLRVLGSRFHRGAGTDAWLGRLGRAHEVTTIGSSLKFCRIAEGAADLYVKIGPTSQWDTAAGQAVLEAAGGAVRRADGLPLAYGAAHALVNPDFVAVGDRALVLPPLH